MQEKECMRLIERDGWDAVVRGALNNISVSLCICEVTACQNGNMTSFGFCYTYAAVSGFAKTPKHTRWRSRRGSDCSRKHTHTQIRPRGNTIYHYLLSNASKQLNKWCWRSEPDSYESCFQHGITKGHCNLIELCVWVWIVFFPNK